jgi:hypothetical protein
LAASFFFFGDKKIDVLLAYLNYNTDWRHSTPLTDILHAICNRVEIYEPLRDFEMTAFTLFGIPASSK